MGDSVAESVPRLRLLCHEAPPPSHPFVTRPSDSAGAVFPDGDRVRGRTSLGMMLLGCAVWVCWCVSYVSRDKNE